ncbi:MAG: Hydrolase, TatD family [Candidatus Moranbacteria bacterium GW2011_GWF2_35_39]|nr:MAG: Hydrolase, TatD family [Candidatus Moranbacteria bacterium GW2011_GWF2_35_39]
MFHVSCFMLVDTHAHLNFSAYKNDAEEVIKRTLAGGVFVINVGSQYSTSVRAVEYAKKYDGLYAAIGIHPLHLQAQKFSYHDPDEIEEVEIETAGEIFEKEKYLELVKNSKVVAIGEVGLDYHHFESEDPPRVDEASPRVEAGNIEDLKNKQKEIFLEFINLANEVRKPIMIHCWDAYDDLYEILEKNPVGKRGVIHSFVGSFKTAKKFIELGYLIGLNGIITYGISYDKLIREVGLKDIVLETDCPYLTPVPKKGERNEPIYVKYVAQKIAEVKEISPEEVEKITTENANRLFRI